MSNPNFVNDLVMMAKAYEELPIVQADLMTAKNDIAAKAEAIQRLELRLIDAKNELDAAREATRKAEVERDHAENMFLETDQKLDSLRAIIGGFKGNVDAWTAASEPVKAAPTIHELEAILKEDDRPVTINLDGSVSVGPVAEPEPTAQPKAEANPAEGPGSAHEVTVESPLAETGQPVPTSGEPPATSTDTALNTTSQVEAGSSGNTDSGGEGERPLSGAEPSQSGPTSDARDTASVPSGSEGPSALGEHSAPSTDSPSQSVPSIAASMENVAGEGSASVDDVGYHNEPDIGSNDWLGWYDRMNVRYGNRDGWPARTA